MTAVYLKKTGGHSTKISTNGIALRMRNYSYAYIALNRTVWVLTVDISQAKR